MLSDPVWVPRTFWRETQGAPPSRRPWALLLNRFTVRNTGAMPSRPPLRPMDTNGSVARALLALIKPLALGHPCR